MWPEVLGKGPDYPYWVCGAVGEYMVHIFCSATLDALASSLVAWDVFPELSNFVCSVY